MKHFRTSRERAAAKRRANAIKPALAYLNAAFALMPGVRKGTAEKRVRESGQPMTTAKAFVKEYQSRKHTSGAKLPAVDDRATHIQTAYVMELGQGWPEGHQDRPPGNQPDFSAATEARSTLLRRQPSAHQQFVAYEDELGELERALSIGSVSQRAFDKRCYRISEKSLPNWMNNYRSPPPPASRPTLGKVQNYGPQPAKIDMPPVPLWLRRYKTAKNNKRAAA